MCAKESICGSVFFVVCFIEVDPSLGFQFEGVAVAGDKAVALAGGAGVADDADFLDGEELVVVGERDGKQEFVVLSAGEGAHRGVHVEFLGHAEGLVVDGDFVLVDAASQSGVVADVEDFGGEAVGDVHHGGGLDFFVAQDADDVTPGLGLELAFEDVLVAGEVGLDVGVGVEHGLFPFQQLEAHVGGSEVAAHADEVVLAGGVAVDDVGLVGLADDGDTEA